MTRRLKGFSRLYENAVLGAFARSHHYGNRGRKTKGARTGNHQHRYSHGKSVFKAVACKEPDYGRNESYSHDRRNENPGYLVGKAGDRSLGSARFLHEAHYLTYGCIFAHAVAPYLYETGFVDGGGYDFVALAFFYGYALACYSRFVHRRGSRDDFSVRRDTFAGAYHENVSRRQLPRLNFDFLTVSFHGRRLWRQIHQLLYGLAGFALGAGFHIFSHRDQSENHGRRLKVYVGAVFVNQRHVAGFVPVSYSEQSENAVNYGCPRAHRNEAVHVGAASYKGRKSLHEKLPVQEHDRNQKQHLNHNHCQRIFRVVVVSQEHRPHGHRHQRNEQHHRPD